jgi:hypothetical protein
MRRSVHGHMNVCTYLSMHECMVDVWTNVFVVYSVPGNFWDSALKRVTAMASSLPHITLAVLSQLVLWNMPPSVPELTGLQKHSGAACPFACFIQKQLSGFRPNLALAVYITNCTNLILVRNGPYFTRTVHFLDLAAWQCVRGTVMGAEILRAVGHLSSGANNNYWPLQNVCLSWQFILSAFT